MLNQPESVWNEEQKRLKSLTDKKKVQKSPKYVRISKQVLAACKTWGGPCQSVEDLNTALLRTDNEENSITQRITYYKLTHGIEFSANRQLFRVRGISHEDKLQNFYQILSPVSY